MPSIRLLIAAALMLAAGAASAEVRIVPQDSGVKVRLRGISAVSSEVAWASGREGTVLRTVDGGKHWQAIKVPGAGELDFRDVEGFDAETAVVLSIGPGEASRVYRTEDGGESWKLALQNQDPKAFFDCMAFNGERGWMMGDPVDGRFQIYQTVDAGKTWRLMADGPKAETGEAAFAASGTCLAATAEYVVAVTGGQLARAHVMAIADRRWLATDAADSDRAESSGFFSVAANGPGSFLLAGGDYKKETSPGLAAGLVASGDRDGRTIRLAPLDLFKGYRSGVACGPHLDSPCIAVGPAGVEADNAQPAHSRKTIATKDGYDAVDLVGDVGWASGDDGRIARIEIVR